MIARWGYPIAGVLVLLGVIVSPLTCCGVFVVPFAVMDNPDQFRVPGTHDFYVDEPRLLGIYNEVSGIFDGARHTGSVDLPNTIVITVTDSQTGQQVTVFEDIPFHYIQGDTERHSIVTFQVPAAGWYEASVTGLDQERVFTVEQEFDPSVSGVVAFVIAGFALTLAGVVLFIVTRIVRGRGPRPRDEWVTHLPPPNA